MKTISRQISRFLAVGFTAAALDYLIYRLFLFLSVIVPIAKAFGFIGAGTFAYLANRMITFSARGSMSRFLGTWVLYGVSISFNVGINSAVLALAGRSELMINVAFVLASAVSATTNFLGMKYLIFRENPADGETA